MDSFKVNQSVSFNNQAGISLFLSFPLTAAAACPTKCSWLRVRAAAEIAIPMDYRREEVKESCSLIFLFNLLSCVKRLSQAAGGRRRLPQRHGNRWAPTRFTSRKRWITKQVTSPGSDDLTYDIPVFRKNCGVRAG